MTSLHNILRIALTVAAIIIALQVVRYFDVPPCGELQSFFEGLGWKASFAFLAIYALAIVAFVPWSVFTVVGGVVFDFWWAILYVHIGVVIGITVPFLIARYLAKNFVQKKLVKKNWFANFDEMLKTKSLSMLILIRLIQVFPYAWLNYASGVMSVKTPTYILASTLGMVPSAFIYVYLGNTLGCLYLDRETSLPADVMSILLLVIGIRVLVAFLAMWAVVRKQKNFQLPD